MRFIEILPVLEKIMVFSINDLRLIDANYTKSKISLWAKKWYIVSIKKWFYMLAKQKLNTNFCFFIANRIYKPSYISLESALSYYSIIPEAVFSFSSITTKKTTNFETNKFWNYLYKSIKQSLYFGYKINNIDNVKYCIWEPEKVIIDYLYINKNLKTENDFFELRINKDRFFELIDLKKLDDYLNIIWNKSLSRRINLLINYLKKW